MITSSLQQQQLRDIVMKNSARALNNMPGHNSKCYNTVYGVHQKVWIQTHPLPNAARGYYAKLAPRWTEAAKIVKRL